MISYESDRPRSGNGLYYSQMRQDLFCGLHLHNSFELIYICSGCVEATVGSSCYTLSEAQALLIFPNQIHAYRTPEHSESYVCIFPGELIGEFHQKIRDQDPVCPVFSPGDPTLPHRLQSADKDRYLLKSELYRLVYLFDRNARYYPRESRGFDLLGKILTMIAQRYTEPITMQQLARELGYDHRYLTNLMQQGLHTTFRRLLNEYRISHAKKLLSTTNQSVETVAQLCGYESPSTFNRNFRAITGTAPSQWRRLL